MAKPFLNCIYIAYYFSCSIEQYCYKGDHLRVVLFGSHCTIWLPDPAQVITIQSYIIYYCTELTNTNQSCSVNALPSIGIFYCY